VHPVPNHFLVQPLKSARYVDAPVDIRNRDAIDQVCFAFSGYMVCTFGTVDPVEEGNQTRFASTSGSLRIVTTLHNVLQVLLFGSRFASSASNSFTK
jgi:hypothetical protein